MLFLYFLYFLLSPSLFALWSSAYTDTDTPFSSTSQVHNYFYTPFGGGGEFSFLWVILINISGMGVCEPRTTPPLTPLVTLNYYNFVL